MGTRVRLVPSHPRRPALPASSPRLAPRPGRVGALRAGDRQGIATELTNIALEEMRARGIDLAIVATGGDPGHAPARATYEKAGFTGIPQVWYARHLT